LRHGRARPISPVARIDLLAPEERTLLLETWNRTTAVYPSERCIHQLFEEQVPRDPDAIALALGDETLSYGELNARANRLAHYLIEQGVQPDARVAICVDRSFAMVIGLLAILKAGGAYVPLDPAYPSTRLAHVLVDAEPVLVLTDAAGRIALGDDALRACVVIDLDEPPLWHAQPVANPTPEGLTSRHLAYVIYTSGSTGTPKGAQNEHRALINRLVWMQEAYRLDASDVVLQKTPFGFDVSVWEFFWTLLNGATLALAPPVSAQRPFRLGRANGAPPGHDRPLRAVDARQLPACRRRRGLHMRCVVSSAAAKPCLANSVKRSQQRIPHAGIHNLYGPTEAAVDVSAWTSPVAFHR
jgi:non-ribosomal peptide synthetase component F